MNADKTVMFEPVIIHEARPIVWLKRVFVFVIVALCSYRTRTVDSSPTTHHPRA